MRQQSGSASSWSFGALVLLAATAWLTASGASAQYCWSEWYKLNSIRPTECTPGEDVSTSGPSRCFPKCAAGYLGVDDNCWKACPSGLKFNNGACVKPSYPTTAASNRDLASCEWIYGKGNCTPAPMGYTGRCPTGKHLEQNRCVADCPEGLTDRGNYCENIKVARQARALPSCPSTTNSMNGLCFAKPPSDVSWYGSYAWTRCPSNAPVSCGVGCTTTPAECARAMRESVIAGVRVLANHYEDLRVLSPSAPVTPSSAYSRPLVPYLRDDALRSVLSGLAAESNRALTESEMSELMTGLRGASASAPSYRPSNYHFLAYTLRAATSFVPRACSTLPALPDTTPAP